MCSACHLVHGWSYRRNVVANIREQQVDTKEIDTKEFEYTSTKIKQSFSNYSAWHYRSKVLPSILKDMTDEERTAIGKKGKEIGSTHATRCVGCLLINCTIARARLDQECTIY